MDPLAVPSTNYEKMSTSETKVPIPDTIPSKDEAAAKPNIEVESKLAEDPNERKPKPTPWGIDGSHEHAPEKPKEDQWAIILKPLMDSDTAQCAVWKDEVGTLLIFAGLFSAVVTTFVIESYKFLQPDPNNLIVDLLLHIAMRRDGPDSNGTSSPSIVPTSASIASVSSFAQTSSSIRINAFWFLSLVFSLATVLVGTISLQWLREHQSYPNLSSKEKLAMLRMRSEAMERWYVPHIFSALPLLLQGGLALFLAGMIDFSFLLGPKIAIPVCVAIVLTLLFLLATTVLPTLQGFAMYLPYRKKVPSPCPYKSPQSQAFRTVSRVLFRILHLFIGALTFTRNYNDLLSPYISKIWCQKTWIKFDAGWLFIRDACHQRALDFDEPHLYEYREELWYRWAALKDFPLSDLSQALCESVKGVPGPKHTESFLLAAHHCLEEVSRPPLMWPNGLFHQRNQYFHRLLQGQENKLHRPSLSTLFPDTDEEFGHRHTPRHASMFHYEHTYIFLEIILQRHDCPPLIAYRRELRARIMRYLFGECHKTVAWHTDSRLPIFLASYDYIGYDMVDPEIEPLVDGIKTLFTSVASELQSNLAMESMQTHRIILRFLSDAAATLSNFYFYRQSILRKELESEDCHYTSNQYTSLFQCIAESLDNQIFESSSTSTNAPSPLFYISSPFVRQFARQWKDSAIHDSRVSSGLKSLLDIMRNYKEWTDGSVDGELETRFQGKDWDHTDRFSRDWWAFLDHPTPSKVSSIHSNDHSFNICEIYEDAASPLVASTSPSRRPIIAEIALTEPSSPVSTKEVDAPQPPSFCPLADESV